jgi:hypothetical protein
MPDWDPALIDPAVNRKDAVAVGWVLVGGGTFSTNLPYIGAGLSPDPGNVSAFRAAAGNASNAAVTRMTEKRDTFVATKNAIVYDEVYSDGMVLVVVLENNNGIEVSFEIPNPDVSMFQADRVTLDPVQAQAAALISAAETLINNSYDPANSFAFVRGLARPRKVNIPSGQKERPAIAEPGAGDLPADAPAV